MTEPDCPKCRARKELGLIIDSAHGGMVEPQWLEGAPEKSFWRGLKVKGKEKHPVRTFRCPSCGYLESYAHA